MNLIRENIENLTSLWQIVGERANAFYQKKGFSYCGINYSEWPNRLWFHGEVNDTNLQEAKALISGSRVNLKIAYWDIFENNALELFEKHGFIRTSEQIGMSLKVDRPFETTKSIKLEKVANKSQAVLWSDLFKKAFNYDISYILLLLSSKDIDYFLAYNNNQPVGTCMVFSHTKEVTGIHSLGIIPEMRRKGYAEEIMNHILDQSYDQGFKYVTLQASEMARAMYEKLGFLTQFKMYNYNI
ncbi:GNAT family N-acetyltransferase [Saccharicrinis sp. FJH62]|uniref:GNAT family N-acetyltransferase n=1 Tax=Saccharicrinis sp. FJH62 TaxID=3344657 RepID=UPI0035D3F9DF